MASRVPASPPPRDYPRDYHLSKRPPTERVDSVFRSSAKRSSDEPRRVDELRPKRAHTSAHSTVDAVFRQSVPSRRPTAAEQKELNTEIITRANDNNGQAKEALWNIFEYHGEKFNIINLTTFIHRLGTKGGAHPFRHPRFADLKTQLKKHLPHCEPRNLGNIAYGLARGGYKDLELFKVLTQEIIKRRERVNWGPLAINNVVYAYSISEIEDLALFTALAKETIWLSKQERGLEDWEAQQISIIAHAYAKNGMCSSKEFKELFAVLARETIERSKQERGLDDWKPQNISNIANAYAKSGNADPALFEALAQEFCKRSRQAKRLVDWAPQAISNLVHAYAKSGMYNSEQLRDLFNVAAKEIIKTSKQPRGLSHWKPQEISMTAYAYAISGMGSNKLFSVLEKQIIQVGGVDWTPQQITMVAYAYAISGMGSDKLFTILAQEIIWRSKQERGLADWNAQDISNTAYAYAKSERGPLRELFTVLAREIIGRPRLRDWTAQEISNTVYAYDKSEHEDPELFTVLANETIQRSKQKKGLEDWKPQHISMMVDKYAKSGRRGEELLRALEGEIIRRSTQEQELADWKYYEICLTVAAYVESGRGGAELLTVLAHEILLRSTQTKGLEDWDARAISRLVDMYTISELRNHEKLRELLTALADEIIWRSKQERGLVDWNAQDLRSVVHAYAKNSLWNVELLTVLAEEMSRHHLFDWSAQNLSMTAYTYVLFLANVAAEKINPELKELFKNESIRFLKKLKSITPLSSEDVSQALQVAAYVGLEKEALYFASKQQSHLTRSRLQQDVSYFLVSKGFEEEVNLGPLSGYHHVDFANRDRSLLIEVDGPFHYQGDDLRELSPTTILRNKILERNGRRLICIPYWEWDGLKSDADKERYVARLLKL